MRLRWLVGGSSADWHKRPFHAVNGVTRRIWAEKVDASRTMAEGNGAKGPFCCCISLAFVAPSARTMSQYTGHSFGSGSYPRVESSPYNTDTALKVRKKHQELGLSGSYRSPADPFGGAGVYWRYDAEEWSKDHRGQLVCCLRGAVGNDVCRFRVDAILDCADWGPSQCAGPVTFFTSASCS